MWAFLFVIFGLRIAKFSKTMEDLIKEYGIFLINISSVTKWWHGMDCIKEISEHELKSKTTGDILHRLPQWFGIETSIQEYIHGVKDRAFWAAFDDEEPVGFICIKENNPFTAEIYVIGILEPYHRKGFGHKLLGKAENYLRERHFRFLMVKTLSDSCDDEYYQRTRAFYGSQGFYPLEEIVEIWGKENPCLIMVKVI
jgi:ribosomal protein S18 acetylase RimI-like enzyme